MQKVLPPHRELLHPEILKLVPTDAKLILDVGCRTGTLGAALKQRQPCKLTGIELHPPSAGKASRLLDRVYQQNPQTFRPDQLSYQPDLIIFNDILEHLPNPWNILKRYSQQLHPDGKIIASIPLIDHPNIIYNLQRGLFTYKKAGITDFTHLRFFTQSSIFQMFAQQNLKIIHSHPHPSRDNPQQLLLVAKKVKLPASAPQVTIIMLSHNALEYTKQALASLQENTTVPHQLIVVDNNSIDGTQHYLHSHDHVLTIEHTHNLGCPAAFNSALHCIRTPYFASLNTDTILTPSWLTLLTKILHDHPDIGIIGPTFNEISGQQKITPPEYKDNVQLDQVARQISKDNQGHIQYNPRILFTCVLLRTELLRKIGPLDERFGLGMFEDDDYSLRAILAGYKTAFTKSVYIHHHGGATFKDSNIDQTKLIKKNIPLFIQKWGQDIFYNRRKIYENLPS